MDSQALHALLKAVFRLGASMAHQRALAMVIAHGIDMIETAPFLKDLSAHGMPPTDAVDALLEIIELPTEEQ
jgi:hypothetical protein